MAALNSRQGEFISIYSKMRAIASTLPNLKAEFDRAFADALCMFNPENFIQQQGHIGLEHKISSLKKTLRSVSGFALKMHNRTPSSDDRGKAKWLHLSSTFWNDFIQQTMDELEQSSTGRLEMSSLQRSLPKPTPRETKTRAVSNRHQADILKNELLSARGRVPLYRGHNACTQVNCANCLKMFDNLPLTRCVTVHGTTEKCVRSGWFPHLTSQRWSALRNAHDRADFTFTPRPPAKGELSNPLLLKSTGTAKPVKPQNPPPVQELEQSEDEVTPVEDIDQAAGSTHGSRATSPVYDPDKNWEENSEHHFEARLEAESKRGMKRQQDSGDFHPRRRRIDI